MDISERETPIDKLPDEVWNQKLFICVLRLLKFRFFQVLSLIFNRINFHGHLRLSGVCQRWNNVVKDDVPFMRTVKFKAASVTGRRSLIRSYRYVVLHNFVKDDISVGNLEKLTLNAEKIDFGCTNRATLNCVMPLCVNATEIELMSTFNHTDITALAL
jgi:F-box domain